jgi:hypothetical protein
MKLHTLKGARLLKRSELMNLEGGTLIYVEGDDSRTVYLKTNGFTFINIDNGESRDYIQLHPDAEYRVVKNAEIVELK